MLKKVLSLVVVLLGVVAVNSCTSSPSPSAQHFVDEVNAQKDVYSQPGAICEGAKVDGKKVVITINADFEYGAELPKAEVAKNVKSALLASMFVEEISVEDKLRFKEFVNDGYSIVYHYKDIKGDIAEVEMTNAELKDALQ